MSTCLPGQSTGPKKPPKKKEIAAARARLKDLDEHAPNWSEEIESIITLCQSALAEPQSDLNRGGVVTKLLSSAKTKQAQVKRIVRGRHLDRLPLELLAIVFELVAGDNDWRNRTGIALSHVNRAWRALALRLPDLWRHFIIPHQPFLTNRVTCTLERSKQRSIKVRLATPDTRHAEILDMVSAASSRIVWLEYNDDRWAPPEIRKCLEWLDVPNVRYVSLTTSLFLRLRNTPKLHHLNIPWNSITKAFAPGVTYPELQLLKCRLENETAVNLLAACPNLRRASFDLAELCINTQGQPNTTLTLLERLAISDVYRPRLPTLLTFLGLPNLRHLVLKLTQLTTFHDYKSIHLPQLETFRMETGFDCSLRSKPRKEPDFRIGLLLTSIPNIHKLALSGICLAKDIFDMTSRFRSGRKSDSPFLPRLRTLVLVQCGGVEPPKLKRLLLQWAAMNQGHSTTESPLTLRIHPYQTEKLLEELGDSWSGVVDGLTKRDKLDSADYCWLTDASIGDNDS